jgi:hypothetical protein
MMPVALPFILFFALFVSHYEADRSSAIREASVISEWVEVFAQHNDDISIASDINPAYTAYVNISTLRKEDDIVRMWSLIDFSRPKNITGKPYLSVRSLDEYDCKERQSRSLSYSYSTGNMGDGEVIVRGALPTDWYPIEPVALAKVLFNAACKKR